MEPIYKQFIRESFAFLAIFLVLTFVIYFAIDTTVNLIAPNDRYEEPLGRAIKVISQEEPTESLSRIINYWRFFIELGE